jgi:hypothetical protein
MTRKAKRLSVYFAVVATPWGLATIGLLGRATLPRQTNTVNAVLDTDAAYCDGLFLGKLDGQQGRSSRPSIGRWNTEKDRSSFRAGYEKGYKEALASRTREHRH